MGQCGKLAFEVVFLHLVDLGFEVEAGNNLVGPEEDANLVINSCTLMVKL